MSTESDAGEHGESSERSTPAPLPIGRLALGAMLVVLGALWLLDATGVAELRWSVVLPAALTVVGVAVLASARRGVHGGLLATGIVLTVLVLLTATTPFRVPVGGIGDRVERPTTVAQAQEERSLLMGSLTVDLRDVEEVGEDLVVGASVGVGELVVRLPDGVGAEVEAATGIGEVDVVGRAQGGLGVSVNESVAGEPTIILELSTGIGRVEVDQ